MSNYDETYDETYDEINETYDEIMMKLLWNCFKMFSAHERLLGPRIRT